jgi:SDR family mycofactocin-dependent oxidoreductase
VTAEFDGKVAFITGAARGQGRSHAVRFAEEGADIIAVDVCRQLDSVGYPMATPADLEETVELVEKTGRRIVAAEADVRDFARLKAVVADGISALGRVDFVLANAGIMPFVGTQADDVSAFDDAIDVMLKGVHYTIEAALPEMLRHGDGGAIVITSSTASFSGMHARFCMKSEGGSGYVAAKEGVVGLMRYYANALGEKNIRVNTVHPAGVASPMVVNDPVKQLLVDEPEWQVALTNPMPVELLEPSDVSDTMVYLCGRSGRYVTGVTLPVDAGNAVK